MNDEMELKTVTLTCIVISIYSEYLYGLVEAAGLVIERDVANWIANQGGWVGYLFLLGNIFYSKILLQK